MLKCVLLDANIIIESHKVGVWEKLIDRIESLSLIKSGKLQNMLFCSSDGPAIQTLAMIGHSNAGISMDAY